MQQVLIGGRYRLLGEVGRGGMGRVWRAHDEMLHRDVAVKQIVPPAWLADDERAELRSRTLREARTAARLADPHVVRLYDVIEVDGDPWIVMEYVPSRTLQDVLDAEGPLAPERAARIGLAVLAALRAAHSAGVLHRDVKPQNVLVAHDGRVLLTDFGLAVFDGDGSMTRPGLVLGSPPYVAPERAAEGRSSVAADLWSLGATLHATVEGRSPYARDTAMATLTALATAPPDPAPRAGPLAPVLAGLLRREPGRRIDHEETERLLTAAASVRPPTARGPAPPTAGGARSTRAEPDPTTVGADGAPGGRVVADDTAPVADPARALRVLRRGAPAAAALLVATVAGVGTALAVTGDEPRPPAGTTAGPVVASGQPPAPPRRPGPHRPPPGRDGLPPPPFPCVRPYPEGSPARAQAAPPGERFRPPTGWSWHADDTGFRVAVPAGWWYSIDSGVACFQDPATGRALSVAGPAPGDPVERLRAERERAARAGTLPGYQEIRFGRADGGTAWECRWDAPHAARLHATQLVPGTPAGAERWLLGWITDDRDWAAAGGDWATIRASFRPPR
ncbi:protein kinase domain-containing protein [Micromonospora musae]|uniref:protein kinase domain-containing protein n=1 Tax=Micromonospora musae TaxID=1894970 RepID=UPI0033C94DE1